MQGQEPIDVVPLSLLLIGVFVLVLLSVEGGYRLGRAARRGDEDSDSPLGEMIGATLGLLAFLLAFTFSLAATRYDTRRQLLLAFIVFATAPGPS
jgi:multisubunit Na+/H+ antiporter MnhG subunit